MPVCGACGTDNPVIARFCLACGAPLAAAPPPQEVRKVVTIVFSDLKGSTSMGERLDSESLREVMTRYFDAMRAELERHGGVVEKFIGDAIMAVFGLPRLHEDDALRAVRAATDMQAAQAKLNDELERNWGVRLAVRTGVNTGEVVAGDPAAGQRLVTGDTVNVAARLEQAAGEQEILLGYLTYRLVRDFVDVEPVEPLELKGKAEPVPAYRLLGLRGEGERPGQLDAPLVGREAEVEALRAALGEAVGERRCRLVTVLGEAGVGKSRLVDEFVRAEGDEITFLRGRCLSYGDGITYWPLAEAVRQAAAILDRDPTEVALQKLSALPADDDAEVRVASAMGLSPIPFPGEELAWGARRLLEAIARERPLVLMFEDVHWAEPTFLELVEHLVDAAEDAPLLLVCTARHELVERRPHWSEGARGSRLDLQRLGEDETSAIAEHLLGETGLDERVRARVVEASGGNPLFVGQLVSMLIDEGLIRFEDGRWRAQPGIDHVVVPPTIQALLAARLDHLEPEEREVVEPASVVGQAFVQDAVAYLLPDRPREDIGLRLGSLTNKQLVEPDRSRAMAEEAFRFQHILIRDTAYEGILKRARAGFHERFVEWADGVNREGATEYEEILGYHLEQAHRYLTELAPVDLHGRAVALDGSRRLASAGRRAFARGDAPAAANLLERAVALLADDADAMIELLPDYGEALLQVGRFADAEAVLDKAIEQARARGAAGVGAHAALVRLLVLLRTGAERWLDEAAETITPAMAVFQEAEDDAGMARAWRLLAFSHGTESHFGKAAEASEQALEYARKAGDRRQEGRAATAYAAAAVFGPTPVSEAIDRCERAAEQAAGDRQLQGFVLSLLASLVAMQGSFDRARELAARGRAMLEELGLDLLAARVSVEAWRVEMLAGDPVAAERELRIGYEALERMGEKYLLSTIAGLLGQTLCVLERFDEAEPLADQAQALATPDDVDTQPLWRCLRANILVRRGSLEEAEAYVRDALAFLEPTESVLLQYGALVDLAGVLRLAGRDDEAEAALEEARALARLKQSPVLESAIEALLAEAARLR